MRTLRLSSLLLPVFMFSAEAQAHVPDYFANILHMKKNITESPRPSALAKTTDVGSRLKSFCVLKNNGAAYIPTDSAFLIYSNNRTGSVNLLTNTLSIKYDTGITSNYNTTTNSYVNGGIAAQTFDANNNILTSLSLQWNTSTSTYDNANKTIYTYDANNNMLSQISQSWNSGQWVNSSEDMYTYDANNNMLTDTYQYWDITNSVWVIESKDIYTYTAANKVNNHIYQEWNSGTMQWDNSTQLVNSYDANNNLLSSVGQDWDAVNSVWTNNAQDVFTYDGSNDQLTDLNQTWNGTSWQNSNLTTYSSFVAQNPQNVVNQQWDDVNNVWVNKQEILLTYNSFNQELTIFSQTWNVGGLWEATTNDMGYRFHYETYTLSVNEVTNNGGNARIYPVPASDVLHISLTWDEPQAANIVIYDVQGRVMNQWKTPTGITYNNALSVGNLAEGTYFIKITGEKGEIIQKLVVAK